jgi:hypothetical protein
VEARDWTGFSPKRQLVDWDPGNATVGEDTLPIAVEWRPTWLTRVKDR